MIIRKPAKEDLPALSALWQEAFGDTPEDAYGNPVQYIPLEYEITGIRSSWGVNFGQITLIMIAALVICVAAVGFVMYRLNKRKLKRGYIPELDEEDLR